MATTLPPGLSPDAVDTLTELTSLITRLRNAQQQSSHPSGPGPAPGGSSNKAAATPIPGGVTGTTPLSHPTSNPAAAAAATPTNTTSTPNPNQPTATKPPSSQPPSQPYQGPLLSNKDLPLATDHVKHKLQRARAAVRELGDVSRGVSAQASEAQALEARRRAQAGMLGRAQEEGLGFVRRGSEMEVEGGEQEGIGERGGGGGAGEDG